MNQPPDLTYLAGETVPGEPFDVTVERAETDRLYVTLLIGATQLSGYLTLPAPAGIPAPVRPHTCTNCGKPFFGPVCDACGEPWSYPLVATFDVAHPACPECGGTDLTLTGKQIWQTVERWQAGDCDQVDTHDCYGWSGWVVGQCATCDHQFAFKAPAPVLSAAPEGDV